MFFGTTMRALSIVCTGSQPFGVGIVLCFFFSILDSLRKIFKNFENYSQLSELVGKPDLPFH